MKLRLKLIAEKSGILDYFSCPKILGTFLILLAFPVFFILPFFSKNHGYWIFPYIFSLFGLFAVSWLVMLLKYRTNYDFKIIGELVLSDDKLVVIFPNETQEIGLITNSVKLLYNGIRNHGFHYGRDFPRSGISELTISNHAKIHVIVNTEDDFQNLKKILRVWYNQRFEISEFTLTKEQYRLIELEKDFDWKRLTEIKNNVNT